MQIVKYEIIKKILIIGFKESNFVVYSQIVYDTLLTKEELLQNAYIQCKNAIEYEKTQVDHSFVTDEIGEEFAPDIPKTAKVVFDNIGIRNYFSCLQTGDLTQQFIAKAYDQYGDIINKDIVFTLDNTPVNVALSDGLLTIGQVDNDYDLILTANCEGVTLTLPIYIRKYVEPVIDNTLSQIDEIEATLTDLVQVLADKGVIY